MWAGKRLNTDIVILICFLVGINAVYFDHEFMAGHDTKNIYSTFHYFYNHFVLYKELPQWLPYGEYGYSSLWYQISNFSPCSYLIGLGGYLLGAGDTLLLFKLSIFADQLILLLGLYLLTEKLFGCRHTRLAVCICGCGSVVWHWQLYWDLRLYYLIPLALYFYHRFLVERLSWAFWATLLTMTMGLVGGLAYWAPVYLFLFLIINAVLMPKYWKSFSCLISRFSWFDLTLIVMLVTSLAALAHIYTTCLAGLHNLNPGRAPGSMATLLKIYLTYSPPLWGCLHSFFDGTKVNIAFKNMEPDDLTLYVGLASLAGLGTAIVKVKNTWFYAILAGFIAIVLVSGSGLFSVMAYRMMPGMNVFRHLSLLMEISKILLLLAGGYGLEIIFRNLSSPVSLEKHLTPRIIIAVTACFAFILDQVVSVWLHREEAWISSAQYSSIFPNAGYWVALRLLIWIVFLLVAFTYAKNSVIRNTLYSSRTLCVIFIVICAVDMGTFQIYHWRHRVIGKYGGKLSVEPLQYKLARTLGIQKDEISRVDTLLSTGGDIPLALYSNAMQIDPCLHIGRMDIFSKGVSELLNARGATPPFITGRGNEFSLRDRALANVLGCETSKLRLAQQTVFKETDYELKSHIMTTSKFDLAVLLRGEKPKDVVLPEGTNQPFIPAYSVVFFNANRLVLDVNLNAGQAGWLVYADAFNPYWKAVVNGREKPLYEAYMAFKAVYLAEGRNRVEFIYDNLRQKISMGWLAITGVLTSGGCLVKVILLVRRKEYESITAGEYDHAI